jgi:hypothetical protein
MSSESQTITIDLPPDTLDSDSEIPTITIDLPPDTLDSDSEIPTIITNLPPGTLGCDSEIPTIITNLPPGTLGCDSEIPTNLPPGTFGCDSEISTIEIDSSGTPHPNSIETYIVEIYCAPGTPRPDIYFTIICKKIGMKEDEFQLLSKLSGGWSWEVKPESIIKYEAQRHIVREYLTDLYHKGYICYGDC